MGSEDSQADGQDADRQRVEQVMGYIRSQIDNGKRRGANLSKADELFTGAQFMLDAGNYEDAMKLLTECSELAGDTLIQYDALVSAMRCSQRKISEAEVSGQDTSEARKKLHLAEDAMHKTDYRLGIAYAVESSDIVDGKKKAGGASWL